MSQQSKILAFAGSNRKQSFNQKLVAVAAAGAREAGAEVTLINLAEYDVPIYNQDLENAQGIPEKAIAFKKLLTEHDGFLIASPEYNSAFTPFLKNMIDWASRKESDDELPLQAYNGKFAVLMATSPGALGGLRGLTFLRMLLANLGVNVLAVQQAVPFARKAFEGDYLVDEQQRQRVMDLGRHLSDVLKVKN